MTAWDKLYLWLFCIGWNDGMIIGLVIIGMVSATLAGLVALLIGQPWWIALAIYSATGLLTVLALGLAACISSALRHNLRRHKAPPVGPKNMQRN